MARRTPCSCNSCAIACAIDQRLAMPKTRAVFPLRFMWSIDFLMDWKDCTAVTIEVIGHQVNRARRFSCTWIRGWEGLGRRSRAKGCALVRRMSGKGAEGEGEGKNFLERPGGRGILRDASSLGTFPDIQPIEGCGCS